MNAIINAIRYNKRSFVSHNDERIQLFTEYCEELIKTGCFVLGGAKMCKWNVVVMILLSGVLAGSSAATPIGLRKL